MELVSKISLRSTSIIPNIPWDDLVESELCDIDYDYDTMSEIINNSRSSDSSISNSDDSIGGGVSDINDLNSSCTTIDSDDYGSSDCNYCIIDVSEYK